MAGINFKKCAWALLILLPLVLPEEVSAQRVVVENRTNQSNAGHYNSNFNTTNIRVENRQTYQRQQTVFNDYHFNTNIISLPPEVPANKAVVLRQSVTLRGDFTTWSGKFGNHEIVISRRAAEFRGTIVTNSARRDRRATEFFSFSTWMMQQGAIRQGKQYRYQRDPYEVRVHLAEAEAYGQDLVALSFRVLVLADNESSQTTLPQTIGEPIVWEGNLVVVESPVGDFHLKVDPDGYTTRIEYCPGPTYHENRTIAKLSKDALISAIQTGREIDFVKDGYRLTFVFEEAEFDYDDGTVDTLQASVYRLEDFSR